MISLLLSLPKKLPKVLSNNQIPFLETDSLGYYEKEIRRDAIYPIEAKHIQYTITNQVL